MFRTLHGHVVCMNLISMILFKISLLVIFHATNYLSNVVCTILGFFTYFCSIAMFSWITGRSALYTIQLSQALIMTQLLLTLAVMCFDLHQTFTSAKV